MTLKVRNEALYGVGVLSYIVSLIPFVGINLLKAIILIPILAYNLPIMEYLQPKAMVLKLGKKEILLAVIAAIPYIFLIINYFIIIPAFLLLLTFFLYYKKNTMMGTVVGTTFVASLSTVWSYFVHASFVPAIFWTFYIFSGAIFVEYKIPHRKLKKNYVIINWILVLIILTIISIKFNSYLLLLTLIEPSLRFLLPGEKLKSMKELPALGRKGAKRDMLFVVLLAALSVVSLYV
ncbi:hypothetical protein DFR86_11235 [Acidianus sulfidivorans JP7]|uniref:Uncharacterized protein n=1 Tax=Acidianus sulfidivorans JP7 TaxID=619593 RepID=A0A2U9IPU1_9CREN|nr:hypothetical protein [Acidianus sulfidivorans]AWR98050.1 hypothetical protein DFR86_11235 [Acidianus sulfidivorans JP7]